MGIGDFGSECNRPAIGLFRGGKISGLLEGMAILHPDLGPFSVSERPAVIKSGKRPVVRGARAPRAADHVFLHLPAQWAGQARIDPVKQDGPEVRPCSRGGPM